MKETHGPYIYTSKASTSNAQGKNLSCPSTIFALDSFMHSNLHSAEFSHIPSCRVTWLQQGRLSDSGKVAVAMIDIMKASFEVLGASGELLGKARARTG